MWDLLKSGGILIIPIILCGMVSTFIIIERCIWFANVKKNDALLKKNLFEAFERNDFNTVKELCQASGTPFAQVVLKAVNVRNQEERYIKEIVESEMERVVPQYEHSLTLLGTIASISTLLGLLGTVTGNIKAFGKIGEAGSMGNAALLAGSISEALVTTAAGLSVAIPAMIFSNYFNRRVDKEIIELETSTTEVILKLTGRLM